MSLPTIELIILDLRYFIDESLTFVEFYECGEREIGRLFMTNRDEINKIRKYTIEFINSLIQLKTIFQNNRLYTDFNLGLELSKEFKNKRVYFFRIINTRLDNLYKRLYGNYLGADGLNEIVVLYYKHILKISRNTNEFINFIENSRWNRDLAFNFLDNLVSLTNGFSGVFELFVSYLESNNRIKDASAAKSKSYTRLIKNKAKPTFSTISNSTRSFSKKPKYCPCILIIMVFLILIVLFFIVLPFYSFLFNKNSNVYSFKLDSQKASLSIIEIIYTYLSNGESALVKTSKKNKDSIFDFSTILNYMADFYVFSFSFLGYVIVEILFKFI